VKRIVLLLQLAVLAGSVLCAAVSPAAAAPATVSFKVVKADVPVANTEVVLILSYGTEVATTNAKGEVSFHVGAGKGYWVEVGGRLLDSFFEIPTTPPVVDIAKIPSKLVPKAR